MSIPVVFIRIDRVGVPVGGGVDYRNSGGGEGDGLAPVAGAVTAAVALYLHFVGGFRGETAELSAGGGSGGSLPRIFGPLSVLHGV